MLKFAVWVSKLTTFAQDDNLSLLLVIDTERRLDIFCVNENVSFPVGNL